MKKIQKGFTLVELLVVIAIIAILASIVLSSVGNARDSAKDAKVQETLSSLRAQAEVYFSLNSGYSDGTAPQATTGSCASGVANGFFGSAKEQTMISSLDTTKYYCVHDGTNGTKATKYAMAVILPSTSTAAWCIDSNGNSKKKTVTADTPSGAITSNACN